ncbi:MAG: hypothetical protein J4432_01850 [DPANN group archaeon]|nr:hypothetical protein [DPANN group archaeon]
MGNFKDPIEKEFEALLFDVKYDKEQFKEPETIGLLLYRLAKEREQTNRMLAHINDMLNQITQKTNQSTLSPTSSLAEAPAEVLLPPKESKMLLPPQDMKILEFVAEQGHVNAEQVRKKLKYKGRNAASARLNALCGRNVLRKTRVGRTIVFEVQGRA